MALRLPLIPPNSSRRIAALLVAVVFVGVLLSLFVYRFAKQADDARIAAEFDRRADGRGALVHEILNNYQSGIYTLKALFDGSEDVSRQEFSWVAADMFSRYPGISALEWVPLIPAKARAEFEAQVSRELGGAYRITERSPAGAMVPAAERAEYCPIVFLEPLAGNERAFGYDVLLAPSRPFLDRARSTGQFAVSSQFELVQNDRGIVMIWPVFSPPDASGRRAFRGFVQGIFRIKKVFDYSFTRSPSSTFDVLFLDATATDKGDRILYYRPAEGANPADLAGLEAEFRTGTYHETTLELGGRRWLALFRPSKSWLEEQRTIHPALWLVAGLIMTALVAALIGVLMRRTAAIGREVALRTTELSESRRQLAHVLHALPGMAYRCSYDEEMTVLYVSEGAFALTGYRPDEFVSAQVHFRTLIHPDDLHRVRLLTRAALDTRSLIEVEYRIRPRTGPEKWVLSRARGVDADDGRSLFVEGLAIDITARKHAELEKIAIERRLLESQKLESLGLLAGGIAHDFNNLLTGILGNASLARFTQKLAPAVEDYLTKIESGANRAAELCQQMLAYSGRGRFVIEPVNLDRLVESTLPLLRPSLPERADLQLKLSRENASVMGDATQLRQILMNLILNAADALGATGGRIDIVTGIRWLGSEFFAAARTGEDLSPGNYVVLEVRDTGCGMSPETLAKIFDPFFTTKFTGRGLGLAAVLGIVRGHHGALHVQSEVAVGTTFTLALPPCNQTTPAAAPEAPASSGWRHHGSVLVIDDEPPVRNVAAELVRTFGMEPVTAADGTEGLIHFEKAGGKFDVVFLDLTMPGLSGPETLEKLRMINSNVRVLLVSGFSDLDRIAHLASGGPLVFMQKPFTRADLEAKLRELLG
jgi:PAS domain S-box-containing protein